MEKDLTALKRKWLKKHLQALRAVKDEEEEKVGMPGFVGILCALLPLLTAAIYLVGMRYYHGYLDRFGLEYTEFSQPADVTLFHGFLLLLQLLLPYVFPLVMTVGVLFATLSCLFFKVRWRLTLSWWVVRFFVLLPIVMKGGKIARTYPAPFTFSCLIWLKNTYLKFALFMLPILLVIWASEYTRPMGEKEANKQITLLEQHVRVATAGELHLGGDVIVLAAPEIGGLPLVVTYLVAAGGLAAALSTADGLLLSVCETLRPHARALAAPREAAHPLGRAIDYMQAYFARPITLTELAGAVNLSPYHFQRSFKARFHVTPQQMLMAIRLQRAKGWLAAGLPAAEVAAACGLADQSHLNRAFLRRYGTTPVRYQKQVQAGR